MHPLHADLSVLIVAFQGEYGHGSQGNDDATFMKLITSAALEAWPAHVLILDFRKLRYEWGDMLSNVLTQLEPRPASAEEEMLHQIFGPAGPIRRIQRGFVLVSDLCREGMTSLIRDECRKNPREWIAESLEEALRRMKPSAGR